MLVGTKIWGHYTEDKGHMNKRDKMGSFLSASQSQHFQSEYPVVSSPSSIALARTVLLTVSLTVGLTDNSFQSPYCPWTQRVIMTAEKLSVQTNVSRVEPIPKNHENNIFGKIFDFGI
jgi:hypothetical protein